MSPDLIMSTGGCSAALLLRNLGLLGTFVIGGHADGVSAVGANRRGALLPVVDRSLEAVGERRHDSRGLFFSGDRKGLDGEAIRATAVSIQLILRTGPNTSKIVLVCYEDQRIGLVLDRVMSKHQTVIQAFGPFFGMEVMALILGVSGVVALAGTRRHSIREAV